MSYGRTQRLSSSASPGLLEYPGETMQGSHAEWGSHGVLYCCFSGAPNIPPGESLVQCHRGSQTFSFLVSWMGSFHS